MATRRLLETDDEHVAAMLRGFLHQCTDLSALNYLDVHIACFSEAADLATQWRDYADEGRGYCLEFELGALAAMHNLVNLNPGDIHRLQATDAPAAGLDILPVVYRTVRQSVLVQRAIDGAIRQFRKHASQVPEHSHRIAKRALTALFRCAAALSCQFKQPKWAAEREWRLALIGASGHARPPVTIPFLDLNSPKRTPLRSVTVGPLGAETAQVQAHLARLGHEGVRVVRSLLPAAACAK